MEATLTQAEPPQGSSPRVKASALPWRYIVPLLLITGYGGLTGVRIWKQGPYVEPKERSQAWVDDRVRRFRGRVEESLPNEALWETYASNAMAVAREKRRLLFVVATHGDVLSARL